MAAHPLVIVGAGLAGATTAFELRRAGFDRPILLIGDEPVLPYERPELTKGYLVGEVSAERLLVRPREDYAEHGIAVRTGVRAGALDPVARTVLLADGESIRYERCVIATGLTTTLPAVPGIEQVDARTVRTLADADALRERIRPRTRVLCLGMGFIGCEIAATAHALGADVVGVDPMPGPMWAALGPALSARMADLHTAAGIVLHLGSSVERVERTTSGVVARFDDGASCEVDVLVTGTGARADTGWLEGSGIDLDRGLIVVDEHGRTSLPGVHAAGDVTLVRLADGTQRHHEHWQSALDQGIAVARDISGLAPGDEHLPAPWFWSVQHGRHLQVAGVVRGDLPLVFRHDDGSGWLAIEHEDGLITAVVALDMRREFSRARRSVAHRVDPSLLGDASVPLSR